MQKNILLTCNHAGYGGVAKYIIDLAEFLLSTKKYRVFIAVGGKKLDLLPEMQKRAEQVFILKSLQREINPIKDLAAYFEIKKLLKSYPFDIVHSNGAKASFLFRRVCFELGIPNVYTHHLVVYRQFRSVFNPLYKFLERTATKWCNKVIVVSKAAKEELVTDNVTPGSMIEVIHNGLSNPEIKYSKEEARKKLNISEDSFVFVSVSRLSPPKDPITALIAFKKIVNTFPSKSFLLFFVGDGSYRKDILSIVKKENLQNKVFVTGFQSDVDIYLAAADVFILSTRKEGLPISILEALKYSLPVVASKVDGIPEEVIHGENGFIFEPGNEDEIYHYMKLLATDEKLRQRMAHRSREILIENFMIYKNFNKIIEIYEELLSKK